MYHRPPLFSLILWLSLLFSCLISCHHTDIATPRLARVYRDCLEWRGAKEEEKLQSEKSLNELYRLPSSHYRIAPENIREIRDLRHPDDKPWAHGFSGALARAGAEGAVEEAAAWSDT